MDFWPTMGMSLPKTEKALLMTPSDHERTPLIYVVDDDWMNREVMEAHLRGAGYGVQAIHSGEKALEMAIQQPPDLVLLDVRMQGMGGYETCRRFKAHDATRLIPVIMVSALDSDQDKQKVIDAGADDFILKPFTSLAMLVRVKNLLLVKRLRDELSQREELLRDVLARHVDAATADVILSEWNGGLAQRPHFADKG